MQLLLGFLLPLVLAFDTRENSTSTTSEQSPTTVHLESTKAQRHLGRTLDGPVLVSGLVHQQRLESKGKTEKSEKVNNGENQQQTTELPVSQASARQKDEQTSLQTKSVEFHQFHQLHQTTTAQQLGQAVPTEETRPLKKVEHQAPLVEELERRSHPQNMRHSGFEVDEEGRAHLPVDPFSLHHPFLHTSVAEFEYSEWYLLLFSPSNASLLAPNTDSLPNQLSRSLAEKLEVSPSTFHISSIDSNRSGAISANISLTRLTVPHLHRNLCHLPQDGPAFKFDGKNFTLATVRHDKNQHLYIRTNPSTTTTGDELGLLLTVTLGGLGMFLLVMAFSFLAAQIVSKQDLSGVSDLEDILVEHREGSMDSCDVLEKEIFIIDNSDEPEGLHHEGFCAGEERRPAEVSKEEMRRWKDERGEESRRIQFGQLGARLGRSWRELWDARLINID